VRIFWGYTTERDPRKGIFWVRSFPPNYQSNHSKGKYNLSEVWGKTGLWTGLSRKKIRYTESSKDSEVESGLELSKIDDLKENKNFLSPNPVEANTELQRGYSGVFAGGSSPGWLPGLFKGVYPH
jgi:hypothetical protein